MYLGKAEKITFSGFDKQNVIDQSNQYCKDNEGWSFWSGVLYSYKWIGWFKWKKIYEICLYKPVDYRIVRDENKFKVNDAVDFAEWIIIENWDWNGDMKWERKILGMWQYRTSKELYDEFLLAVKAVTPNEVQK